ncbi:MAG: hypothetical protein QGG40_02455, partial [Myxococcota bacterium]|nr:hypothetical protein [Myxococcota bacterium]
TLTPDITVYDSSGEELDSTAGSTDYPTAVIENVATSEDTYYLKVSAPEGTEHMPSDWYRFIVYVASFEIGNYSCP